MNINNNDIITNDLTTDDEYNIDFTTEGSGVESRTGIEQLVVKFIDRSFVTLLYAVTEVDKEKIDMELETILEV